ncbi:MAG: hypothetical protein RL264_920 [Bacteroidota bacterium]|jgi:23S rRNA (cytosine1962-C5)-methyltransferase
MSQHPRIFSEPWSDYELIDAGGGKKLERWGTIFTIRPEVNAYFRSEQPFTEWRKQAHWEFIETGNQKGKWKSLRPNAPQQWTVNRDRLKFQLRLSPFKHVGLFPEQNTNWNWLETNLTGESTFLNLFAYTGAASCVARNKGASTFHVDSAKSVLDWAGENMELSRLLNIRWVHEDALKFLQREVRRGRKYDCILMDPPAWGIGVKGEKWVLEDNIDNLLSAAADALNPDGKLVMNTYSPTLTFELLSELAAMYFPDKSTAVNELFMRSTTGKELYFGLLLRVE